MKFFNKKSVRAEPENDSNIVNNEDNLLRACLADEVITRDKAVQISALTGAVDLIANTVANIPIKLYKKEDDKTIEIKDDYRTYLLNEDTGDTLDANQMKQAVVRDYFLGKGGYIYVDWDGLKIRSLRYVFNEYISIVPNVDVIFKDYTILVQGRSFFPYQFVTVLRNTVNGMWGNGITQENSELLKVAYTSLLYEKGMVATGGNKKGFVKSQRKLSQAAIEALKKAWRNLYSNTSENVIVLNDGLEFQEASNTSVEMQLNQNKITNDSEIRNILGIPENINTADGDKAFLKYAISNFMGAFTTALNRALLTEKEKGIYYFEADMDNLTKADMDTRFNAYKTATDTGWLQIDEIREKENMEPLGIDMVKMGLQDVLYNPESDKMYIPNMNQSASLKNEIRADKNIIINGVEKSYKEKEVKNGGKGRT